MISARRLEANAAGRLIPIDLGTPFQGVAAFRPSGRQASPPKKSCADYPPNGNKLTDGLVAALKNAGLRDGMVVSTHHHFRNGDLVAAQLFAAAETLGVRDLVWFPSAVFPCHEPLLQYLENGIIHHIEGSLN